MNDPIMCMVILYGNRLESTTVLPNQASKPIPKMTKMLAIVKCFLLFHNRNETNNNMSIGIPAKAVNNRLMYSIQMCVGLKVL